MDTELQKELSEIKKLVTNVAEEFRSYAQQLQGSLQEQNLIGRIDEAVNNAVERMVNVPIRKLKDEVSQCSATVKRHSTQGVVDKLSNLVDESVLNSELRKSIQDVVTNLQQEIEARKRLESWLSRFQDSWMSQVNRSVANLHNFTRDLSRGVDQIIHSLNNEKTVTIEEFRRAVTMATSRVDQLKATLDAAVALPQSLTDTLSQMMMGLTNITHTAKQSGSIIAASTELGSQIAGIHKQLDVLRSVSDPLILSLDRAAHTSETLNSSLGRWQAEMLQNLPAHRDFAESVTAIGNQLIKILDRREKTAQIAAISGVVDTAASVAVNVKQLTSKPVAYASV